MRVALIYFSATNNTREIAIAIKDELIQLKVEAQGFDITSYKDRQRLIPLNPYDAFIFGFPIYAWRAPKIIREWLLKFNGSGKKCSLFFTYGGVHVGAAHHSTKQILDAQDFKLVLSAEFIGKHTYNISGWNLNINRPDQDDLELAREFARVSYRRFSGEDPKISKIEDPHLSKRILDRIESVAQIAVPPPSRVGEECSMCRTCEDICPTNAMIADSGNPKNDLCIRCFRCIVNCPDEVLVSKEMGKQLDFILKSNNLTKEIVNKKKSRILY